MNVAFCGYTFTLIGTHLEAFYPPATYGQAQVLLANVPTARPVVLAGDFNANASDASDPTYPTYQLITQSGFTDAWEAIHPGGNPPGYTCCQLTEVGENLTNFKSLFNQRIDHVFVRDLRVISAQVIGREQSAKTAGGLWPSDHGGLLVDIALK
jgi:endonuclease/exonuclease/phosphatase family metal-dependent hydrolase